MANYPKKMMDPTEAALSAIQEALNIKDEEIRPEDQSDTIAVAPPTPDQFMRETEPATPAFEDDFIREPIGNRGDAPPPPLAANDDQQSVGQVLRALQRRPVRTSYFVAALFSAAWIVGCLALSWAYLSELNASLGPGHSQAALMIGLGAAALLPIIFFFGVAHIAWRSQELRLITQAMAQVALRLSEPENIARDSIVTVGQAIRREVAAMGDGVERALARAGELESMVQNEVAALERSYSDNEVRIRSLLQDLSNQRDTLVGQAEQVRSAINNVHIDLTQDLSTISDLVGQQVNEAAQRITHSLAEKGEHITVALGEVGDNMIQQLSMRGNDLLTRLESASDETSRAITTASDQLTSSLNFKTDHVGEDFAEIVTGLEDMMTARLDAVADNFSERSLSIVDTMIGRSQEVADLVSGRAQELSEAIVDTSSQIAETIASRADDVNSTLRATGESLILDLNLRGGDVAKKLEQTGNRITEALVSRSTNVTDSLRESVDHLVGTLATRGDTMKDMLTSRLGAFEEMFNHSGAELGERISRDSATLGNLITRHLAEFDRTVKTYGSELVERLGARTQDVSESMRGYVESFDNRVTTKATEVTTALDERLTRFQDAMDGRTQTLTDALASRVMDIAKTIAEGGKDVVTSLDKRLSDVTTLIDTRAASLSETVTARVANIDKTLGVRAIEVANNLDERMGSIDKMLGNRALEVSNNLDERMANIDKTLGSRALEVANTLDGRIGQLEHLLVGRTEAATQQLEARSRSAAELLTTRLHELVETIKNDTGETERAIIQLTTNTTEALAKTTTASNAAAETLNRNAVEATVSLNRSAVGLSDTISKSASAASESVSKAAATAHDMLSKAAIGANEIISGSAAAANQVFNSSAATAKQSFSTSASAANEAFVNSAGIAKQSFGASASAANETVARVTAAANDALSRAAASANEVVNKTASAAKEAIGSSAASASDLLARSAAATTDAISLSAGEAERKLVSTSVEVARNVVGKADEFNSVISERLGEMTLLLDEKSNGLLTALTGKGHEFANEVSRVTDHAVKSIEAKSFVFTQTMMDNSEEIARLINDASQTATKAMTVTLGQLQDGAQGAAESAKSTLTRTLSDIHSATRQAVEESKQTAAATVADMLETHNMLRSDSTALFERLREANILLQEVLSGAHENMNSIEHTMATRVSEFVAAMNDLTGKSSATTSKIEQHLGTFNTVTGKVLRDLGDLSGQFNQHGRSLAEAVQLLEISNRKAEETTGARQTSLEGLVTTLDLRTNDFEQRLQRFSSLLDESLDAATTRTREIASLIAETSNDSVHSIEQQFEIVRASSEEERKRTGEALNAIYNDATADVGAIFTQSAERFTETIKGMKQMATEMQRELETTRTELRRGVLELPQETAESAAQMRRVIVDQIDALAELNRIIARHGRAIDAAEPMRREPEQAYATGGGGGRGQVRPIRPDITPQPQQSSPRDITGAPARRPEARMPPNQPPPARGATPSASAAGSGWLTDLLSRASREETQGSAPAASRDTGRYEAEAPRDATDSLDTLSVDIARMIDHEAAADLWERQKRGEKGLFSRRIYTLQGQKAFDEIREKYRTDPEFRQTVEHYIHEFERLLDDVSRGDRGAAVVRNYLTSDTGKVYTMLAHAAGRFDR